jgi:hypothetical protein
VSYKFSQFKPCNCSHRLSHKIAARLCTQAVPSRSPFFKTYFNIIFPSAIIHLSWSRSLEFYIPEFRYFMVKLQGQKRKT